MLIIDDDADVRRSLEALFAIDGFRISTASDGEEGMQLLTALPPFDVVLMDVILPKKSGFDVLRDARRAGVTSPIILVTVRGEEKDKLRGFDLGADDYVTKPFNGDELSARVSAVIRRAKTHQNDPQPQLINIGKLQVDAEQKIALYGDDAIAFTTLEFEILRYFIQHRGRTVSRKQMLRDVWGISGDIETRTIDRHVASLRRKIEADSSSPEIIETVYGIGYKFLG